MGNFFNYNFFSSPLKSVTNIESRHAFTTGRNVEFAKLATCCNYVNKKYVNSVENEIQIPASFHLILKARKGCISRRWMNASSAFDNPDSHTYYYSLNAVLVVKRGSKREKKTQQRLRSFRFYFDSAFVGGRDFHHSLSLSHYYIHECLRA